MAKKFTAPDAVDYAQWEMSNSVVKPLTLTIRRGNEQFDRTLLAVKPLQPTNIHAIAWHHVLAGGHQCQRCCIRIRWSKSRPAPGRFSARSARCSRANGEIGVQQLGGAVMIIRVYSNLFQDEDGWRRVLWFSVILNVNLALLNMLPLPVLDGGHITLSLIEVIRRRPVSARVLNTIQSGFAALLIGFMVYIAFFDTGDWVRSAAPTANSRCFCRSSVDQSRSRPAIEIISPCATANLPIFISAARRAKSSSAIRRNGGVIIGGDHPVVKQSMLTCDTMDTALSVKQTLELVAVGCQIVRITAPTVKDAANLQNIVAELRQHGCLVPIVADIHFKPEAAMEAVKWVEVVRVNPGNYADSKKFAIKEYTDEQYAAELKRIEEKFTPLVMEVARS